MRSYGSWDLGWRLLAFARGWCWRHWQSQCESHFPDLTPVDTKHLFEILVREHMGSVRAFLLASLRDSVVADDLLQETFLTAWRTIGRYDRRLPFGPWVRGIAGNLLLNHRRTNLRARVQYCDHDMLVTIDESIERLHGLPGDTFTQRLDVLRASIKKLSQTQREVIELHYEDGLGCQEISNRLGLGFEAVKKHLQRGRSALQRAIDSRLVGMEELS